MGVTGRTDGEGYLPADPETPFEDLVPFTLQDLLEASMGSGSAISLQSPAFSRQGSKF